MVHEEKKHSELKRHKREREREREKKEKKRGGEKGF